MISLNLFIYRRTHILCNMLFTLIIAEILFQIVSSSSTTASFSIEWRGLMPILCLRVRFFSCLHMPFDVAAAVFDRERYLLIFDITFHHGWNDEDELYSSEHL